VYYIVPNSKFVHSPNTIKYILKYSTPLLISGLAQGTCLFFLKYFSQNFFLSTIFLRKKELLQSYFLLMETPKPPDKKGPVQNWSNPAEIGSPPEIYIACQMTFKSDRIFKIWRTNPPSGNAECK
jgi:hypothetical protein